MGGYTIPKGSIVFLKLLPNKHVDPLRQPLPANMRRCPFDHNEVDRTATGHDGFDFNPNRWLDSEGATEGLFDLGPQEVVGAPSDKDSGADDGYS